MSKNISISLPPGTILPPDMEVNFNATTPSGKPAILVDDEFIRKNPELYVILMDKLAVKQNYRARLQMQRYARKKRYLK